MVVEVSQKGLVAATDNRAAKQEEKIPMPTMNVRGLTGELTNLSRVCFLCKRKEAYVTDDLLWIQMHRYVGTIVRARGVRGAKAKAPPQHTNEILHRIHPSTIIILCSRIKTIALIS